MAPAPDHSARDRILAAARILYEAHGGDFSLAQLAEQAEVSRSTLARRFRTRAEVFQALTDELEFDAVDNQNDHRERVLRAAKALVGRHGPSKLNIELVAQEADVSPVTVYRHFGDTPGLLRAALDELRPQIMELHIRRSEDLRADLLPPLTRLFGFMQDNPGMARVHLFTAPPGGEVLDDLRRQRKGVRAALTDYFEPQQRAGLVHDHAPPEELAHLLMSLIVGSALIPRTEPRKKPITAEEAVESVLRVFLHGIER